MKMDAARTGQVRKFSSLYTGRIAKKKVLKKDVCLKDKIEYYDRILDEHTVKNSFVMR